MPVSAAEQYMLELINRARLDPAAEAKRLGIDLNAGLAAGTISKAPKQVLAFDPALDKAAEAHSKWMLDADIFSHKGSGGSSPRQRMEKAGYALTSPWATGENIALASATDLNAAITQQHIALFKSASHRTNILDSEFRQIGIAQVKGAFKQGGTTYTASSVTQDFARSGTAVFITGVAYGDANKDGFYSVGEGASGRTFASGSAKMTTDAAGGYALRVATAAAVQMTVTHSGKTAVVEADTRAGNVKIDLVNGDTFLAAGTITLKKGIAKAQLIGIGDYGLTGGGGNDTLTGNAGRNILNGGDGHDLLRGRAGNDTLNAGRGNDTLEGGDGDDTLRGGDGNDKLSGDGGADKIYGEGGADQLIGGAGNDTYFVDGADRIVEGANAGTDLVQSPVSWTLGANLENLTLTGSAAINGTGNALANRIIGNSGNNALNGGGGADMMAGGAGNDTYYVDNNGDRPTESANAGVDIVHAWISWTLGDHLEKLDLRGEASIHGTGNALSNTISGTSGNNALRGMDGHDTLNGRAGNDLIYGGTGNDRLIGSLGADQLTGDAGRDAFVFAALSDSTVATAGRDTIRDFSLSQRDLLDFSAIDANVGLVGNQAFKFIGSAAFKGTAGELSARSSGGGTLVAGDVDGDRYADFAVFLDDPVTLNLDYFIL